ncbi:DUF308 domain-containing protein [Amycolatopsis thermophila]|uniref:Uncharacterized protein n=1 Tax=Amycolatopsis thermophila TaxID=206084 RepID=A0ABU0F0Q0_9PSEU|nr:DUF308 domain-containing protein [Amycolatopsis thermophila]MDQ0380963.1 hypothetical protein [Amycolatopsis thermophila]
MAKSAEPAEPRPQPRGPGRLYGGTGLVLLAVALAVPQLGLGSPGEAALALGLALTAVAFGEVLVAVTARRATSVALAAVALAGALVALAWPDPTLLVAARVVAWVLLGGGAVRLIRGLARRGVDDLWWLRAAAGAAGLGFAFWAAASAPGSTALPLLWTALAVALSGIDHIAVGLEVQAASHDTPTEK